MTTEPQGRFIKSLLIKCGYPFRPGREYHHLPGYVREVESVEEWIGMLDTKQASTLIDFLKNELGE